MPATKTLFVITPNSEMERWNITRHKVNINAAMIDGITANMVRRTGAVFPMSLLEEGNPQFAGIAIGAKSYAVVRLPLTRLVLTAPFALDGETMFPVFDGTQPITKLIWKIPADMTLYLSVHCDNYYNCIEQHLVALDQDGLTWRLPLSNLYNDGRLCSGRYESSGDNLFTTSKNALAQFTSSSWNRDLYGDSDQKRRNGTRQLFSFTVTADSIVQNEVPRKWQEFCEKMSTEFITNYIAYV